MIDPVLAFQTALRSTLIASPAVSALVPADHIRASATRPERLPAILFSNARTEFLGTASGSQRVARVFLTLHIWSAEDGQDTASRIGGAVFAALEFGPKDTPEIAFDEWARPSISWVRDPQPSLSLTHGAMTVEAVVRWRV